MNSILQVLFHLIPIRKIIVEKEINPENKLLQSVQELFVSLMTSKSSTSASKILQNFSAFCEYPYRQQDIHEFLLSFIDSKKLLMQNWKKIAHNWSIFGQARIMKSLDQKINGISPNKNKISTNYNFIWPILSATTSKTSKNHWWPY